MTAQETSDRTQASRRAARGRGPALPAVRWRIPLAIALAISAAIAGPSFAMPMLLGLAWDDWQQDVRYWFDVGNEGNLPTWWNTSLLIATATLSGTIALLHRRTGGSRWMAWSGLAVIAALLSLDEAAGLHERLRFLTDAIAPQHGFTYAWLAVGIPLGIAVLIVVFLLARWIEPASRVLFAAGLTVLLAGAVGMETVNDLLVQARGGELPPGGSLQFHVIYHVEELLEFIGASMLMVSPLASLRIGVSEGRLIVRTR